MVRDLCLACRNRSGRAKVGTEPTEPVDHSGELRVSSSVKPGDLDLTSTNIGSPHHGFGVPSSPPPFMPTYLGKEWSLSLSLSYFSLSLSSYSSCDSWMVIWVICDLWHGALPLSAPAVRESPVSVTPLGKKGGAFRLTGSQGGWLRKNDMGSDAHLKCPRRQVRPGALCKSKPAKVRSACSCDSSSTSMKVFRTWTRGQVLSNPGGIPGSSHGNDMQSTYVASPRVASWYLSD